MAQIISQIFLHDSTSLIDRHYPVIAETQAEAKGSRHKFRINGITRQMCDPVQFV